MEGQGERKQVMGYPHEVASSVYVRGSHHLLKRSPTSHRLPHGAIRACEFGGKDTGKLVTPIPDYVITSQKTVIVTRR
jgi:hypothetical protein